jgi:phosphoglycolate phosphatase
MKPVDLMMFDFDGTLADTGEDIAASVNHALAALGFGSLPVDVILGFVGDGLRILMERALGADQRAKLDKAWSSSCAITSSTCWTTRSCTPQPKKC